MTSGRVFRCEVESTIQDTLVQNVYHIRTKIPEVYASQVAITTAEQFLRRLMQLQVYYVIYQRLIVTCLEPLAPHMYVLDMENERPGTDVTGIPLPISWKWTGRNITTNRSFIGGFYLGGLQSPDWNHAGYVSERGVERAKAVRDAIINTLGVGGSSPLEIGTFSRTYHKKFPQTPLKDIFVPWASLNFNSYYTALSSRRPGRGR